MPYDTANLNSKALNTNLDSLVNQGLIEYIKKGRTKGIKILKYNERKPIEKGLLINTVHQIMIAYEKSGFTEAQKIMEKMKAFQPPAVLLWRPPGQP